MKFTDAQLADIRRAQGLATAAHAGQQDKIGAPYLEHPMAVAELVEKAAIRAGWDAQAVCEAVQVAWLHDVVEDTWVTVAHLTTAGFHPRVIEAVKRLTRVQGVPTATYYVRVRSNPLSLIVKAADLTHNTLRRRIRKLKIEDRVRLRKKYVAAHTALGLVPPPHLARSRG